MSPNTTVSPVLKPVAGVYGSGRTGPTQLASLDNVLQLLFVSALQLSVVEAARAEGKNAAESAPTMSAAAHRQSFAERWERSPFKFPLDAQT